MINSQAIYVLTLNTLQHFTFLQVRIKHTYSYMVLKIENLKLALSHGEAIPFLKDGQFS